jgi:hypothetical protein
VVVVVAVVVVVVVVVVVLPADISHFIYIPVHEQKCSNLLSRKCRRWTFHDLIFRI